MFYTQFSIGMGVGGPFLLLLGLSLGYMVGRLHGAKRAHAGGDNSSNNNNNSNISSNNNVGATGASGNGGSRLLNLKNGVANVARSLAARLSEESEFERQQKEQQQREREARSRQQLAADQSLAKQLELQRLQLEEELAELREEEQKAIAVLANRSPAVSRSEKILI